MLHFEEVESDRNRDCGRYFFTLEMRTLLGWKPLEKEPVRYELKAKQYERVLEGDSSLQRCAERLALAFRSPVVFVYQDRLCNWADPPKEAATEQTSQEPMEVSPVEVTCPPSGVKESSPARESGIRERFIEPPPLPTIEFELQDAATGRWTVRRDRTG
jgi:hypothetical protein